MGSSDEFFKTIINPEFPLLLEFKERAPGTFQHCEHVSQLCEKIGVALKLNCDFLRAVGLYHDLGKMINPEYFCENQPKDDNIHDDLNPVISAQIIISHVSNTVSLLIDRINDVPVEMLRCVAAHHGDMVLRSMFNKVPEEQKKNLIKKFTYPHNKPSDVYSGTLMICDTVEATLKGLTTAGKLNSENVADKICDIIKSLTNQQQLDELTFKQGRIITEVLITEYNALDHKRVTTDYEKT